MGRRSAWAGMVIHPEGAQADSFLPGCTQKSAARGYRAIHCRTRLGWRGRSLEAGWLFDNSSPPLNSRFLSPCSSRKPRPRGPGVSKRSCTLPRMFAAGLVVEGAVVALGKTCRSSGDEPLGDVGAEVVDGLPSGATSNFTFSRGVTAQPDSRRSTVMHPARAPGLNPSNRGTVVVEPGFDVACILDMFHPIQKESTCPGCVARWWRRSSRRPRARAAMTSHSRVRSRVRAGPGWR